MVNDPKETPNPLHKSDTSFSGGSVHIMDDPGLPLDSPEVLERQRKRLEQLERKESSESNTTDKGEDRA